MDPGKRSGYRAHHRREVCQKQVSEKKRMCQDESDSPRSYEGRSPQNAKQQTNKTVPRGQLLYCFEDCKKS